MKGGEDAGLLGLPRKVLSRPPHFRKFTVDAEQLPVGQFVEELREK